MKLELNLNLPSFDNLGGSNSVKGSGVIISKDFTFESISSFYVSIPSEVFIEKSQTNSITIKMDENLFDEIVVHTTNIVEIKTKKDRQISPTECKIFIKTNDFSSLSLAGAVKANTTTLFVSQKFELTTSGSSKTQLELEASEIIAHLSGSGNSSFSGKADILDVSISGSGVVDAFNLKSEKCKLNISGSGTVKTTAGLIEGSSSGSGILEYTENAVINVKELGKFTKTKI